MDKTKIVYYAFPFHIDMVERTILQLKRLKDCRVNNVGNENGIFQ